jgi:hypothetical protein
VLKNIKIGDYILYTEKFIKAKEENIHPKER